MKRIERAIIINRELKKLYPNPEPELYANSDYEFLLRFLTSNYNNCIYLNKFIVNMTIGGESNKNLINLINKSKEDYQIIKKYNLMGLITLFLKISSKFHQFFNVS